ncbi:MAG: MFS transporter [Anaerolineaceae bacterium]|nr:MFS transporter [Anaerolineaceae bacterium]
MTGITSKPDPAAKIVPASGSFYGWKLLALMWFLFMNFSLIIYGGSILNAYMARALDMSRDSFGAGVSLAYLLMGLAAPLAAFMVNKYGSRRTLFIGILLMAFGSLALGTLVKNAIGFTIAYGVVCGLGLAIGGLIPLQTVVTNWFERRRTLATAIFLSSGGIGGLLASYFFSMLINRVGVSGQGVWLIQSALSFLLAVLAILFVRNRPADMGQVPDGKAAGGNLVEGQVEAPSRVYRTREEWEFKEVLRTATNWLLFVGALGMALSYEFCSAYGVIHLMDIDFPNIIASISIGVLSSFAVVGRLLAGYLGDRIEPRYLMSVGSAMIGVACLLIINPPSAALTYLYGFFGGVGQGLIFVCMFTVIANYYGPEMLPNILGLGMPIIAVATASAILLGGFIRVETGSYALGFVICALIAFVSSLASFISRPPQKPGRSST